MGNFFTIRGLDWTLNNGNDNGNQVLKRNSDTLESNK